MAASRQFVCIRLATYESQAEADFTKKIYLGRSGNVENTTFAILAPNGRTKLTRTGRAPFHEYRDAASMATGMNKIAERYQPGHDVKLDQAPLPFTDSVELGLNISAADGLPIIVIAGNESSKLDAMANLIRPLSWSEDLIGQFTYAQATDPKELKPLIGIEGSPNDLNGILVVQPGEYGLSGKVIKQFDATTESDQLKSDLLQIAQNFERPEKHRRTHVSQGIQIGIDWKSAIPETDAEALAARKRHRGD